MIDFNFCRACLEFETKSLPPVATVFCGLERGHTGDHLFFAGTRAATKNRLANIVFENQHAKDATK